MHWPRIKVYILREYKRNFAKITVEKIHTCTKSTDLIECKERNLHVFSSFKFSKILLRYIYFAQELNEKDTQERDIVTHFLLIAVLQDDLRVLFLECENKEDVLKVPYRVPDIKAIIHLCGTKNICGSVMVKRLKLKYVSLLKKSV